MGLLWTLTFFLPIVWLLHHFTRPHWVVQHLNLLTGLFIGLWVPAAYLFYRRYVLSHRYARLDSRWGRDTPLERTGKLLAVLVLCAVFLGGAFTIFHALEL